MPTNSGQDLVVSDRFRAKYRVQDAFFRALDLMSHPFLPTSQSHIPVDKNSIKKILIVNGGHIGDVIISTALLPLLHEAIPGVRIDFLTGSYSKKVIENHPLVSKLHCLDHWFLSRSNSSKLSIYREYRRQARALTDELHAQQYDLAIDLRSWFPNFISILHKARIPVRIGYDRVGGGPLLTHRYRYQYDRRHELQHQLDLLSPLNIDPELLKNAWPRLPELPPCTSAQVNALLRDQKAYCVLHPGSSTSVKDWPQKNWITLAISLADNGMVPVITGSGVRDATIAAEISLHAPLTINLCNALSWDDLINVIKNAAVVYSVDTSIGHVASALGKPIISIYGGMADPRHWAPLGSAVVTNPISCFPCFQKKGCSHRSCLTGITVNQVQSVTSVSTRYERT